MLFVLLFVISGHFRRVSAELPSHHCSWVAKKIRDGPTREFDETNLKNCMNLLIIINNYIMLPPLGDSLGRQTVCYLVMNNVNVLVMNNVMNPLFSFSQITLVDRKILVSEWICISNSVITLVDKRPKNRLQLILIVHKKYLES